MGWRLTAALAAALVLCICPAAATGAEPGKQGSDQARSDRLESPDPQSFLAPPSPRHGSSVARIVVPSRGLISLRRPGRSVPVGTETAWSGQAQSLLVLDSAQFRGREWVRLLLADRPNGASAWLPRDRVMVSRTRFWVRVRLRSRSVVVLRAGRPVRRFRAVIGKAATPTPRGLSALYERNRQGNPGDFFGPWVLPITFHSDVLRDFGGGPGRVAIHGRSGASLTDPLGSATSHGCIRVNNVQIAWMARKLPAGTPVRITG